MNEQAIRTSIAALDRKIVETCALHFAGLGISFVADTLRDQVNPMIETISETAHFDCTDILSTGSQLT